MYNFNCDEYKTIIASVKPELDVALTAARDEIQVNLDTLSVEHIGHNDSIASLGARVDELHSDFLNPKNIESYKDVHLTAYIFKGILDTLGDIETGILNIEVLNPTNEVIVHVTRQMVETEHKLKFFDLSTIDPSVVTPYAVFKTAHDQFEILISRANDECFSFLDDYMMISFGLRSLIESIKEVQTIENISDN